MADWQLDLKFVNLGAMPEAQALVFYAETAQGGGGAPPMVPDENGVIEASFTLYESVATEKCWVTVYAYAGIPPDGPGEVPDITGIWVFGPYIVGDIATEVPAP